MDNEVIGLTPRERAFLAANPDAQLSGASSESKAELIGISGWLGLLAALLIFVGPLASIGATISQHAGLDVTHPEFLGSEVLYKANIVDWVASGAYCIVSVMAGLILCLYRRPETVNAVIFCLWLSGPVNMVLTMALSKYIINNFSFAPFIGALLRSVLYAAIWTSYLRRSRRVKNTYLRASTAT